MLLFYTVVPYMVGGGVSTDLGPFKLIEYSDAIKGRITGVKIERQYHTYHLDNDTERLYSFNAFMPPLTPAQQQLSVGDKIDLNLGQQLEVGNYVAKQPNSTLLTVQRGDSTSRWFCSTPEEIERAQNAAR